MKNEKIVALLVALCLISIIAIGIPNTIAKKDSTKSKKGFRKSDNPILNLPVDEENWIPIVPPEPVGRPLDEDAGEDIELAIYDIKTKETKRIRKNFTKHEKTTLKFPGSQGSLPSELITGSPIGYGDRVLVSPTIDFPWRTICKLRMWFTNGNQYMGSGFIIDDYHILTAGHCVYDPFTGYGAYAIEVIPALDGSAMPFYHAWATGVIVSWDWYDYGYYEEDFAIITLDRNIGDLLGWMDLYTVLPSDPIYTSIVNTAGYPGDLGGWNMYFDSDWGDGANEGLHWYWMDTRGGQSGSPVWAYVAPDRYVLSIVAYETNPSYPNFGTRLNDYWFNFIDDVREGDTPPTDYANLIDDGQAYSGFSPTPVVPGVTSFSVWSDIRNIGTAASGVFSVSYYASIDTEITPSDYLIGVDEVTSIIPFTWTDSDWSGTFPNIPAGTYYVGWIIDSTGVVPEPLDGGEGNNVAYDDYQLTVESIVSINIEPSNIGFGTINTGESGTDTIIITTTGNTVALLTATLSAEVPEDFYSDNLELDSSPVTGWSISSLAPDTPTPVVLDLYIPLGTAAGSKTANLIFWAEIP